MGWWVGGLVGWWVGGLVGWWVGGLVGWWVGGLVGWWVGGLVGWRVGGLVGWWVGGLVGWWVGWFVGCLANCFWVGCVIERLCVCNMLCLCACLCVVCVCVLVCLSFCLWVCLLVCLFVCLLACLQIPKPIIRDSRVQDRHHGELVLPPDRGKTPCTKETSTASPVVQLRVLESWSTQPFARKFTVCRRHLVDVGRGATI